MKNNYKIAIFFSWLLFWGCTKEKEQTVRTKISNQTSVIVKIFPKGEFPDYDTLNLKPKTDIVIPYLVEKGNASEDIKSNTGIAFPRNQTGLIYIIFNNKDTVRHYNDMNLHAGKYLNKSSARCAFNESSHTYSIKQTAPGSYYKQIIYTITEEDYNFAKQ